MQTGFGEAPVVSVGSGFTIRLTVCVLVQFPLAPVTVYIVVVVGETTTLLPVSAPGFQVYDPAPVAVSVELPPIQIAVGDALAVMVGSGVTTRLTVCVDVQLKILAPVNV
jgi:hypothetical protein